MKRFIKRFLRDKSGASAPEYAVVLALIVVVCVSTVQAVGNAVSSTFASISLLSRPPSKLPRVSLLRK
jgi:pilus assembly protein Flp/PilA